MTECRIIAVASGKGGVGKTWLAVTVAHALARAGRRVLLFDADLGLANIDIQLGLMPACDLSTVLAGRATLADAIVRHAGGFDIIAGSSGSGTLAALDGRRLERLLADLRALSARYDLLLLDLGAGVEPPVRRVAAWADTLLVVVTDEPTSLTDAYAVLKLHAADRADGDTRAVVNMAATHSAGERTFATLERACRTLPRPRPAARRYRLPRRQGARCDPAAVAAADPASGLDGGDRRPDHRARARHIGNPRFCPRPARPT